MNKRYLAVTLNLKTIICLVFGFLPLLLIAQKDIEIQVLRAEDGLTQRNAFKVQQDPWGFIWIATINGINKYDGHEFVQYLEDEPENRIPDNYVTDLVISKDSLIWMANPNKISILDSRTNEVKTVDTDRDKLASNQPRSFNNLFFDHHNHLWLSTYFTETGESYIQHVEEDGDLVNILKCEGNYSKRAITQVDDAFFVTYDENKIWKINEKGDLLQEYTFPAKGDPTWVNQMQSTRNHTLWILFNNGQVYSLKKEDETFKPHPISQAFADNSFASTMLVEDNGDIWVGGLGNLWYYESASGKTHNFDTRIREILDHACTYRDIFKDISGVIWIASDLGVIKIRKNEELFTTYLDDGSEYCSNGVCSMRGITEDEDGNIYFSSYNTIHVLDHETKAIRPLFPDQEISIPPFGLLYYNNAIYTGNGTRIDLKTLKTERLFNTPSSDIGNPVLGKDGNLWFGYSRYLHRYSPGSGKVMRYDFSRDNIDTNNINIHYLYQSLADDAIWIGTTNMGLFKFLPTQGITAHYHTESDSLGKLRVNRINSIVETTDKSVWLATANGLHQIDLNNQKINIFDKKNGLANNFINGVLPEGDSCIWVSTDNGLSRLDRKTRHFINFGKADGISHNEFNRMSFHKAKDGTMYFGGMDGVNAFYPSEKYSEARKRSSSKILFTAFEKYDGNFDSIITRKTGLSEKKDIEITHKDRFFAFEFALADFKNPKGNTYSYILEGYDKDWSDPSPDHTAKYNNIPPGDYVFRVKASSGKGIWNEHQMAVNVHVQQAFYKTWWFLALCILAGMGIVFAGLEYRLYLSIQQKKELRRQVRARTMELERAMKKSDELLLNILPEQTAEELKKFGKAKAKRYEDVTVLFTDFKGFTKIAENLEPEELVAEIDYCFRNFDAIIEKYGIEKIKTIGDAYMCAGGMPMRDEESPKKVIQAAMEIRDFMDQLSKKRLKNGKPCFEIRIGLHTGKVVAGIVGTKKFQYDIWGDTVNVAARMEGTGEVGKVNISGETYQLVKDHFQCQHRGKVPVKNKGEVDMYFVEG